MIILRHAKFISGSRIYKTGETLPDTAGVRELVKLGFAEIINPEKNSRSAKKREQIQPVQQVQPVQAPQPVKTDQALQGTQQNDQGNS